MKLKKTFSIITALLFCLAISTKADNYRVLHHFAGGSSDGSEPGGSLIQLDSILYGMTQRGGVNNNGTIFRINTDGTGFQLMHSFVSPGSDGQRPFGSLLPSGLKLYGTTSCVGTNYRGTIFRINTDGSGFEVLYGFSGADGKWPYGDIIKSGSVLFGMNTYGGNNTGDGWVGAGTVFRINGDGTGFQTLHTFMGSPSDGCGPHGSLVASDSVLYGMTMVGCSNDIGSIFRINTDGTNYQILRQFTGNTDDGAVPYSSTMILSGPTLYGMTYGGGSSNKGVLFKLNTDGTNFQILHSFTGGSNDGLQPYGSLIQCGSILYGMTSAGGSDNLGVVFQINTDGTGFQLLHSFSGGANDGAEPWGSLHLSGLTLYGMTTKGGSNGLGVIFALDVPVDCINPPSSDLNGDCKVDFQDLAILADEWLDCGLEPPSACN